MHADSVYESEHIFVSLEDFMWTLPDISSLPGIMIVVILLAGTIVTGTPQLRREDFRFSLTSHAPRSFVQHGDQIDYTYTLSWDIQDQLGEMEISINGTYLKNVDDVYESPTPVYDGMSLTHTGSVSFTVLDGAPLGALLRPTMFISFPVVGTTKSQTKILGEYVFMDIPEVDVANGKPIRIDVKETSSFDGEITLPSGPMDKALLKIFMPNNVTISKDAENLYIEEPFLSVDKFELKSTTGLLKESVDLMGKVSPYYISNSRTSEIDEVSVAFPEVNVQTGVSGEVAFVVKTELLDFVGAGDDVEMLIGYVLEVGDGIFVIRNASLFTDMKDEVERVPQLSVLADFREANQGEEQHSLKLEVCLEHDAESLGSAYNVSWNIYLPAFVRNIQAGRTNDLLRSTKVLYNNRIVLESSVFEFELTRLSFVHSARVVLNMSLDGDHPEFNQQQLTVYVEAVYNNWRNTHEFLTSKGFTFKLNDQKVPETKHACKCSDHGLFECTCGDATQNGCDVTESVSRCVDCDLPWMCVRTIPEYEHSSRLSDKQGNQYRCGKPERNRRLNAITPCIRIGKNGTVNELSAGLGTLLGANATGDIIYGISRNGLAYMESYDTGITWYSIQQEVFTNMAQSTDFVHATFF